MREFTKGKKNEYCKNIKQKEIKKKKNWLRGQNVFLRKMEDESRRREI